LQRQQQVSSVNKEVEDGFDFILFHFEGYLTFPRRLVATEVIEQNKKYQHFKIVFSREQALDHFKKYNYVDCRINAFPYLKEGVLWKPWLLFIDLDLVDFKSQKSLDLALSKTLKNIKESLNGYPTVLQSGNGYHIIQPVECPIVLEGIQQFSKYNKPSEQFLRFAKDYFSNEKVDKNNYPSFNSCLLRIPGSINSKCLNNRDKRLSGNIKVKVLQSWNRERALITRELFYNFHTYLNQKKSLEYKKQSYNKNDYKYYNNNNYSSNFIPWIEQLLQTPIEEYRKRALWQILCPYIVNVKKLSNEETTSILRDWLDKCNSLRKLDFNPN
jgi:hypothetical protein